VDSKSRESDRAIEIKCGAEERYRGKIRIESIRICKRDGRMRNMMGFNWMD
jgi:hypothetical protein